MQNLRTRKKAKCPYDAQDNRNKTVHTGMSAILPSVLSLGHAPFMVLLSAYLNNLSGRMTTMIKPETLFQIMEN
jgi:hypothetical protein